MKIKLNHPISYGQGKRSTEYGRGVYQTNDPKAEAYIPPKLAQEFLTLSCSTSGAPIAEEYIATKPTEPAGSVARGTKR